VQMSKDIENSGLLTRGTTDDAQDILQVQGVCVFALVSVRMHCLDECAHALLW